MNGHYIREKPLDELYELSKDFWPRLAVGVSDEYKKAVLGLISERLKFLAEIPSLTSFFFEDLPVDLKLIDNNEQLGKFSHDELRALLEKVSLGLQHSDFSVEGLNKILNGLLEETSQKPSVLFSLIRVATTWAPASPGLSETLHVLGKNKSLERIKAAGAALS
jgi:glutamyl-tRNA synthetase